MLKRLISKFLVLTFCVSLLSGYNNYVLADDIPLNEIQSYEEYYASTMDYADSFIIKYDDETVVQKMMNLISVTSIDDSVQYAYENALDETASLMSEFIPIEDTMSMSENSYEQISGQSIRSENTVESWKDGYSVINLCEKVDPDIFMQTLIEEQENIEYIQPNYILALSDAQNINVETELSVEDTTNAETPSDENIQSIEEIVSENIELEVVDDTVSDSVDEQWLLYDRDYNIENANATATGNGVKIAIIDSGIDVNHSAYSSQISNAWDIINDCAMTGDAIDSLEYYHGTHVTGVIASVAPEAELIPIKVFSDGSAYTSDIINAIEYAEEMGADIVNCSWGCTDNNIALKETIENSNMLFVCAAGNNRANLDETPIYPACYELDNIISVSSINDDMGLSYYSNYSTERVDIAAWGRNIISSVPNNEYAEMSGTSVSAAYVSGSAALVAELNEENIKDKVLNTADKLNNLQNTVCSGRKLNPYNAVNNIVVEEYVDVDYTEDFDVHGYQRTPEENWELFCSLDNKQVVGGDGHTLALKKDGTVWAWGENIFGELGIGNAINTYAPQQVVGLSRITQIVSGYFHSLALDEEGHVYSWGWNLTGGLGLGDGYQAVYTPTQIAGLSGVEKIYADAMSSMAVKGENELLAWGYDNGSFVSTPANSNIYSPTPLNINNIENVYLGTTHSAILKNDGTVYFGGSNNYRQFGTVTGDPVSFTASYLENVVDIAIGDNYTLILKEDGTVWGSGYNDYDDSSNDYCMNYETFTQIGGLVDIVDIESGEHHNLAIDADGYVYMWGANSSGQLGDGTTINCAEPELVSGLPQITKATLGREHTLVLDINGTIWGWGDNFSCQLGDGSLGARKTPAVIEQINSSGINKISAGLGHTLILYNDGQVTAFGDNRYGQVGSGSDIYYSTQQIISVPNDEEIVDIAAGDYFSLVLTDSDKLYIWGRNEYSQFGDETIIDYNEPLNLANNFTLDIESIAAGGNHILIATSNGSIYACGRNDCGQLGNGTTTDSGSPELVNLNLANDIDNDVIQISAGNNFSMALCRQKHEDENDYTVYKVYTWGDNTYGQLGNGTNTSSSAPVALTLSGITQVEAGGYHALARTSNGTVYAWGDNAQGQLGDGTIVSKNTPTHISTLTSVIDISAGEYHSGAVKSAYNVWTWGRNTKWQGGGSSEYNLTPRNVNLTSWSFTKIASGGNHNFALRSDGSLFAWGSNDYGQLGDNRTFMITTPCSTIGNDAQGDERADAHEIIADRTVHSSVIGYNEDDWYVFRPQNSGTYNLELESEISGFNKIVYVDNSNGTMASSNQYFENGKEYYILIANRTIADTQIAEYSLTVSFESFEIDLNRNESMDLIENLNVSNTMDDVDFTVVNSSLYRFNETQNSGYDGNFIFKIYNKTDGSEIVSFNNNVEDVHLASGNYRLTVEPVEGTSVNRDYVLNITNIGVKKSLDNRYSHSMVVEDDKVYFLGGKDEDGVVLYDEVYGLCDDVVTQERESSLGHGVSITQHDSQIYAFGGYLNNRYNGKLSLYNLETGETTRVLENSLIASSNAGLAINTKVENGVETEEVYVVGGYNGAGYVRTVVKLVDDTIEETFNLNAAMKDVQAFVHNDTLYIVGGTNGTNCYNTVYAYEYTGDNGAWVAKESIPYSIEYIRGEYYNGIFICAITDTNGDVRLLKYSPDLDVWATITDNFVEDLTDYALDVYGKSVFISGGRKFSDLTQVVSEIESYPILDDVFEFYKLVSTRTIGFEYEFNTHTTVDAARPPVIYEVNAKVIDAEKGKYELYLTADDYICDADDKPYFFWSSKEGVFIESEKCNDYSRVIFQADPNTGNRQVKVIVGIGDGKGQVDRKSFLLNGNSATE